jgi:hypothetical protein
MALAWMPLALAHAACDVWLALRLYASLRGGDIQPGYLRWPGVNPEDVHDLISMLPTSPGFARIWPWLGLVVPLGVLGLWLHHAVWDHLSLWLLGGLKARRGFRTSLLAEAEALRIISAGLLIGFLGYLPGVGLLLSLPLWLFDGYLWLFRGFALAARHGCEPWRGVAATVVHAVLLGGLTLGLLGLTLSLVRMAT